MDRTTEENHRMRRAIDGMCREFGNPDDALIKRRIDACPEFEKVAMAEKAATRARLLFMDKAMTRSSDTPSRDEARAMIAVGSDRRASEYLELRDKLDADHKALVDLQNKVGKLRSQGVPSQWKCVTSIAAAIIAAVLTALLCNLG